MKATFKDPTGLNGINPKVAAGAASGAVTVVLVWVASLLGVDVPAEVASALTVLISTGAAYRKSD